MTRVLIVDDHEAMRRFIRFLLAKNSLEICGEAEDGKRAVELAQELQPDLVVLDLCMPKMDGLEAGWRIRRVAPSTKIVLLSLHCSSEAGREVAKRVCADAFVSKVDAGTELLPTINRVLHRNSGPMESGQKLYERPEMITPR